MADRQHVGAQLVGAAGDAAAAPARRRVGPARETVTNSVSAGSAPRVLRLGRRDHLAVADALLGQRQLDHALAPASACRRRWPSRSSRARRLAKAPASRAAAAGVLPSTSTPEVSRSSRCTSRGRSGPSPQAPSSRSMWRLVLVPPCTARPGRLVQRQHLVVLVEHQASGRRRASRAESAVARSAGAARRAAAARAPGRRRPAGSRPWPAPPSTRIWPRAGQLVDLDVVQVRPAALEPAVEADAVLAGADRRGCGPRPCPSAAVARRRRADRKPADQRAARSAGRRRRRCVARRRRDAGTGSRAACSISRGTGCAGQHQRAAIAGVAGDRAADARPGGRAAGACGRSAGRSSTSAALVAGGQGAIAGARRSRRRGGRRRRRACRPRGPARSRRSGASISPSRGLGRAGRDDGEVGLLHPPAHHRLAEEGGRRLGLGGQDHAGGVAVEPVDQPRPLAVGLGEGGQQVVQRVRLIRPPWLDSPAGLSSARMCVVLVDHQRADEGDLAQALSRSGRRTARRHPGASGVGATLMPALLRRAAPPSAPAAP